MRSLKISASALLVATTPASEDSCLLSFSRPLSTEATANATNTHSKAVPVESSDIVVSFRYRLERAKFGMEAMCRSSMATRAGAIQTAHGPPCRNANSCKKKYYVGGEGVALRSRKAGGVG